MKNQHEKTVVGWIGTGVMGGAMAGHLLEAGFPLHVFNRSREKAAALLKAGAVWQDTPGDVAAKADVLFLMVGDPGDVRELVLGDGRVMEKLRRGSLLVDMTTSSPALAMELAATGAEKGVAVLDAPVSGGDSGAKAASLSIMAGGSEAAFRRAEPLLACMGSRIVLQGPPGSGQYCKLCNQITIAANMLGVCESMAFAQASGLDPLRVLKSISAGAAGSWSLANLAPRMLKGDFAPGFFVKHFIKDLRIGLAAADTLGLELPALRLACAQYEALAKKGGENLGTQALTQLYPPKKP